MDEKSLRTHSEILPPPKCITVCCRVIKNTDILLYTTLSVRDV
jgi:hypothetical protein